MPEYRRRTSAQPKGPAQVKPKVLDWFAEYVYAESIHRFNEARHDKGLPVMTTSQANTLHNVYMDQFHASLDPDVQSANSAAAEKKTAALTRLADSQRVFNEAIQASGADPDDQSAWFNGDPNNMAARAARAYRTTILFNAFGAFNEAVRSVNNGKTFYEPTQPGARELGENEVGLNLGEVRQDAVDLLGSASQDGLSGWMQTGIQLIRADHYDEHPEDIPRSLPEDDRKSFVLPVSPFDPNFRTTQGAMENGAHVRWGNSNQILKEDGLILQPEDAGAMKVVMHPEEYTIEKHVKHVRGMDYEVSVPEGSVSSQRAGLLYDEDDVSKLSQFRPYMTKDEYQTIRPAFNRYYLEHPNRVMSDESIHKAQTVLNWLSDNGYDYKLSPDRKDGQIKARVGNSKLEIRIADSGNDQKYIGRCYNDGIYATYDTLSGSEITEDDVIRQIQYMMGQPVRRDNYENNKSDTASQLTVNRPDDIVSEYAGGMARVEVSKAAGGGTITEQMDGFMPLRPGQHVPDQKVLMDVAMENTEIRSKNGRSSYKRRQYKTMVIQSDRSYAHEYFDTPDDARDFLDNAVDSARRNFADKMDIDGLIQQHDDHADDPDYVPEFSEDPSIAPLQSQYWEVLTGRHDLYTADTTYQDIRNDEEMSDAERMLTHAIFGANGDIHYQGSVEDQVRQHFADLENTMIGTVDPSGSDHKRFNPAMVSELMDSAYGQFRNSDNIVSAMKKMDIPAEELRGDEFQTNLMKDQLLKYNPETAHPLPDTPFMESVRAAVVETLESSHCMLDESGDEDPVQIDDHGVIHYRAVRMNLNQPVLRPDGKTVVKNRFSEMTTEPVEGVIGQVFEPDKDGVVETHYNGSEDKLFVPGYKAVIQTQKPGENKDMLERTRLTGYTKIVCDNIRAQMRADLDDPHAEVGTTTSVNNSYKGLYSTRLDVSIEKQPGETLRQTYERQCQMTNLPEDVVLAQIQTAARMVKYPADLKEESSLNAWYDHTNGSKQGVDDLANDNGRNGYALTGGENMSVLSDKFDGYFDRTATGSAKNQGNVRYLVEGAGITEDGRITPALDASGQIDKNARTPLMNLDIMKYADNTPFDRQQMVFSNLTSATGLSRETGVLCTTAAGYTFDDGCVISSKWAKEHGVVSIGSDGEPETDENGQPVIRPLSKGDKILDTAGNKSVISLVVDLDKPESEIAKLGKADQAVYKLFKNNQHEDGPSVDVVMSPYSPMSRFNATSAKWAINNEFDAVLPDGRTIGAGVMPMIVTDKTVDEKTKQYGDEEVKAGGGRSASGQFNWILSATKSYGLMDECYGGNLSSVANYREYLIATGLDISETGKLEVGYHPQNGEDRHIFRLPTEDELQQMAANVKERSDGKSMDDLIKEKFKNEIDNRGGFLEVPFDMTLPSGEHLQETPADKSAYPGQKTYLMPVLSSYLRSGQEFVDGTSMAHDYTNKYADIYASAVHTIMNQNNLNEHPGMDDESRAKIGRSISYQSAKAQKSYDAITDDIEKRIFEGKHNYVRDHIMSARLPHSATAVWSADPTCKLDEVKMPASMAKTLGKGQGEDVLMWRDPCLHTSSLSGMKVTIVPDSELTGIAVNPFMAARMDGDFDGDSVGLYGVSSEAGLKDLRDNLSFHNNLLDMVHKDVPLVDENGKETGEMGYELFINTKMDVKSVLAAEKADKEAHPEKFEGRQTLSDQFDAIQQEANRIYLGRQKAEAEGRDVDMNAYGEANQALSDRLSQWTHDVMDYDPVGSAVLDMRSPETYVQSMNDIAKTKAKGKPAAVQDVCKYAGISAETETVKDADGKETEWTKADTAVMHDGTDATRKDMTDTEIALAIKSNGTPLAGQISLNFMAVARNLCAKEGLDLTYNATQGVLQSKHDPQLGLQQYGMINGPLKAMWDGYQVTHNDAAPKDAPAEAHWIVDRSKKLTPKEWTDQFMTIHEASDGMNLAGDINREEVEKVAKSLTGADGKVMGVTSQEAIQQAMPMDRIAYHHPKFESVLEAAKNGENLFEGEANVHLAPVMVQKNIEIEKQFNAEKSAEKVSEKNIEAEQSAVKKESVYQPEKREANKLFEQMMREQNAKHEAEAAKQQAGIQFADEKPAEAEKPVEEKPAFRSFSKSDTQETVKERKIRPDRVSSVETRYGHVTMGKLNEQAVDDLDNTEDMVPMDNIGSDDNPERAAMRLKLDAKAQAQAREQAEHANEGTYQAKSGFDEESSVEETAETVEKKAEAAKSASDDKQP